MEFELDEKQLRKKAKDLLKQGTPKQETYEQLTKEFGHPTRTAKILRRIPSKKIWNKYGVWNHILSGLMISIFLMVFLTNSTIGTFIWYGLPTVAILMRKTRFYFWIAIIAFLGTIAIVVTTLISSGEIQSDGIIKILIYFALLLPAAFLAIWLPNKLTPEPDEEREFYENENGEQRSRLVFKFVE